MKKLFYLFFVLGTLLFLTCFYKVATFNGENFSDKGMVLYLLGGFCCFFMAFFFENLGIPFISDYHHKMVNSRKRTAIYGMIVTLIGIALVFIFV